MELKSLMSGIAVVIDDKIENAATDEDNEGGTGDLIVKIVKRVEQEWNLPFYKAKKMPPEEAWPNLLQAASFILLDWKLWPSGAPHLERTVIEENIRFLRQARDYFVPVFIFTNEELGDVKNELPEDIYPEESSEKSFVFIRRKDDLLSNDGSLDFSGIEDWVRKNASVYTLKTWEQAFYAAKKELFSSMYKKSPDWPKVFWKAYKDDDVDPSSSLTHLINDSLRGRVLASGFEKEILAAPDAEVPSEDLQALIGEASFCPQRTLPEDEIRCGDLFKQPRGKFMLNLRPDCDCVSRDGETDEVELYCIEGKKMSASQLSKSYQRQNGHFSERVWESIAFSIYDKKSVQFDFRKLRVKKYAELK